MGLKRNETYDKKTGRKRRKDSKRMRAGRVAARRRRGKKLSQATKTKISRSSIRTNRTGKTRGGRRSKRR